jgi:DNA-binding beta-propeller fold protein YncE
MIHKRLPLTGLAVLVALASLAAAGCGADRALDAGGFDSNAAEDLQFAPTPGGDRPFGKMVIANRGSGTISVLDAENGALIGDFDLPTDPNPPEPMYVVYVNRTNSVLVGDRANSQVVEFDANDFTVQRTAMTGSGVFHMWADPVRNRQLWVNNDVDNTSTVIDPVTFEILATVPMPADLVMLGAKPHDVVLDPSGTYAYVTLLIPGPNDYVVQFDTATFTEAARAAVGKDPHVSLNRRNELLYVPCQNSDAVEVLDRRTLTPVTSISVPGAHGTGMTQSGKFFYTTNLSGGGTDALYAIDTHRNTVVGDAVDAPFAVPHNLALTNNGQRLFLTHSGGTADKVTFYAVSAARPEPVLLGEATVGLNPFGIAFVP